MFFTRSCFVNDLILMKTCFGTIILWAKQTGRRGAGAPRTGCKGLWRSLDSSQEKGARPLQMHVAHTSTASGVYPQRQVVGAVEYSGVNNAMSSC